MKGNAMKEFSPDIPKQRISLILKTVLELLWFEPDGLYFSAIRKYIQRTVALTDYESGSYPFFPYVPRFELIIRIGMEPLFKAGWMLKSSHGRWTLTNAGRVECKKYPNSEDFFAESVHLFQEWKSRGNNQGAYLNLDLKSVAEDFSSNQIRDYFKIIGMDDLRIIVSSLLKAMGLHLIQTPTLMENGHFNYLVFSKDPLGLKEPRIFVTISKPSVVTTVDDIKYFSTKIAQNCIGMFFSFGGFFEDAIEYAIQTNEPLIRTIDLDQFLGLWKDYEKKVNQEGRSKFPLRRVYFLDLPENEEATMKYPNMENLLLETLSDCDTPKNEWIPMIEFEKMSKLVGDGKYR
jgi:hypothetical protein